MVNYQEEFGWETFVSAATTTTSTSTTTATSTTSALITKSVSTITNVIIKNMLTPSPTTCPPCPPQCNDFVDTATLWLFSFWSYVNSTLSLILFFLGILKLINNTRKFSKRPSEDEDTQREPQPPQQSQPPPQQREVDH